MRRPLLWISVLVWLPSAYADGSLAVAISPPRLTVDAQNNASAIVVISNVSTQPVPILLTADDFALDADETMSAKVLFGTPETIPAQPDFELPDPLAPGKSIRVRIDISNLWQAGVSRATLRNLGVKIAEVIAIKDQFPFNVKPVGWKEDAPLPLRFCLAAPASLVLKNEDPQTYSIEWSLYGQGLPLQTGRMPRLRGQSTEVLSFENVKGWIPPWYSMASLLRPAEIDGVLTLVATSRNPSENLRWKERAIPVKIRRSFWSDFAYQWVTFVILSVVLTLGGVASLLLTHWIPNRLKRLSVKELIDSVSPKIRAVSPTIASSLRVGVRVESQRLLQRIGSRSAISPDFDALAADCEAGATRLNRIVEILEKIDQILRQIDRDWPKAGVHGPTLLRRACMLLRDAQGKLDRPELTDAIVSDAEAIVHQAEGTITSSEVLDSKVAGEVAQRVAGLRKVLDDKLNGRLSGYQSLKEILRSSPSLSDGLTDKYEKADEFNAANFCEIDLATTKLELVERFVEAYEAVVDSKQAVAKDHLVRFMEALRRNSFTAFRDAELLVEQTQELVFSNNVRSEIAAGRVCIRYEPQSPKVNQAVSLRAEFLKRSLNADAARNTLTCTWHFLHSTEEEEEIGRVRRLWRRLRKVASKAAAAGAPVVKPVTSAANRIAFTEQGFTVSHYFPTPETQKVWIQFTDEEGMPIVDTAGKPLRIEESVTVSGAKRRAWGERTRIEVARLAIALGIAVFALLGGAQQQISKVDLVPGLIAVFLIGFSSDQIKNIFK